MVAALGPGEDGKAFRVGDRVMVFHYEGCRHCDHCRTGWTQLCDHGARIHGVLAHGGHADYMKVPVSSLVHLPQEMSFAGGAAVACGTGTAYGALLRLDISARDTLAVYGLGPVGLSVAQLAAAMGVEVFGVDINAARRGPRARLRRSARDRRHAGRPRLRDPEADRGQGRVVRGGVCRVASCRALRPCAAPGCGAASRWWPWAATWCSMR
ncbi:alcohol dehydrogenase catalytic domain-containing protein [Cupriavidus basilensis]